MAAHWFTAAGTLLSQILDCATSIPHRRKAQNSTFVSRVCVHTVCVFVMFRAHKSVFKVSFCNRNKQFPILSIIGFYSRLTD